MALDKAFQLVGVVGVDPAAMGKEPVARSPMMCIQAGQCQAHSTASAAMFQQVFTRHSSCVESETE
jgi:hypothetical protein